MSAAEKARLDALRLIAVADRTVEEAAELVTLEALAVKDADKGATYSEEYVKSLRQEAAKARIKNNELDAKLLALSGVDLEELRTLQAEKVAALAKAEEVELARLKAAGDFDAITAQTAETHRLALAKVSVGLSEQAIQILALEAELNTTVIANDIANAAAVAKAWNPQLVEMVVMKNSKVEVIEGKRVVRVLEADGTTKIDSKTGIAMTIPQYVEFLKQSDEYAGLFAGGSKGAGSGSLGELKGGAEANPWLKASFNLTLQGKITEEDPAKAARFRAEAGK